MKWVQWTKAQGTVLKEAHIREFVNRERASAARATQEYWVSRYKEEGSEATIRVSETLFRHMQCVRPDYPGPEERDADLTHHISLKRLLDRASRGAFST